MRKKWWRVWFIIRFSAVLAIAPAQVQADMVDPASGQGTTLKSAVRSEQQSRTGDSRAVRVTRLPDATDPEAARDERRNALAGSIVHMLKDGLSQAAFVFQTILSEIDSIPAGYPASNGGEIMPGLHVRDAHAVSSPAFSERRMENDGEAQASLFGLSSTFGR
jgi:hypothetical protein